ncbi:MAG: hypothetical protein ACRDRN_09685 [Sciscionella sp.]
MSKIRWRVLTRRVGAAPFWSIGMGLSCSVIFSWVILCLSWEMT